MDAARTVGVKARAGAVLRPAGRALARFRVLPWLLAGALAVGATGAGVLGYQVHRQDQSRQREQAVLAAARQEALNFISIDYRRFGQDSQNVLAGATGDFKQQFSDQSKTLQELVTANKAVSSGQVLQAGLVTSGATSARVLIVADSTVVNTAAPKGQVRNYRLQMDLVEQGGRWLASDVQFVG
jgi:Mce-associated membrane protein